MPGILKVGFSLKDPIIRAKELGNTGAPYPYVVEYEVLVENPHKIEKLAHGKLSRFNERKEWFNCSIGKAIETIKLSVDNVILENFYNNTKENQQSKNTLSITKPIIDDFSKNEKENVKHFTKQRIKEINKSYDRIIKENNPYKILSYLPFFDEKYEASEIYKTIIKNRDEDIKLVCKQRKINLMPPSALKRTKHLKPAKITSKYCPQCDEVYNHHTDTCPTCGI